jgi:hypothetical protein
VAGKGNNSLKISQKHQFGLSGVGSVLSGQIQASGFFFEVVIPEIA